MLFYPLVRVAFENPNLNGVSMGKTSINDGSSIATFDYRRVISSCQAILPLCIFWSLSQRIPRCVWYCFDRFKTAAFRRLCSGGEKIANLGCPGTKQNTVTALCNIVPFMP
jgi:hypothetical protein